MNGFEAIKLMEQEKMIRSGIWIYRMDAVGGIWTKNESCGIWGEAKVFNILANDYEEYVKPEALTGWERVRECEHYNIIETQQQVISYFEDGDGADRKLYEKANYFSTKEKAEEINFKQTLFRKLQRFSDENGGNEIDWKNQDKCKYFIYYCSANKELDSHWHYVDNHFGSVYFCSEEVANKAIELFHDDLIKYFTGDFGGKA